jgi:hypothetical protein
MTLTASEVIARLSDQISAIADAAQLANSPNASIDDVYSAIEKCMAADCGIADMKPLYEAILGSCCAARISENEVNRKREDIASVYFIRRADGLVKIGYSHNPRLRASQLRQQHQCEMEILATTLGARCKEKELHRRFSKYRVHGEWFSPSEELMRFVSEVTS